MAISKTIMIVIAVAVLAVCVACVLIVNNHGNSGNDDGGDDDVIDFTLTDAVGREVNFKSYPTRALCTSAMEVESLIYMGLGDKVAAINGDDTNYREYSDDITGVKSYGKGTIKNMSSLMTAVENGTVKLLDPTWRQTAETPANNYQEGDLIIFGYTSYEKSSIGSQLDALGLRYFVCPYATSVQGVYDDIEVLGKIFGEETTATKIVDNCKEVISKVKALVSNYSAPSYAITMSKYAYGGGYILGAIAEELGSKNAFGITANYAQISAEDVIQGNPGAVLEASWGRQGEAVISNTDPLMADLDFAKFDRYYTLSTNLSYKYGPSYRALTSTSPHLVETYLMITLVLYGDQLGIEVPNHVFTDDYQTYLQKIVDKF